MIKKYYGRRNKYGNVKVITPSGSFDSKKEAGRWEELLLLERAKEIHSLRRQVRYEVHPGYTNNQGKKIRAIHYIADFDYMRGPNKFVEDSKGMKTEVYKIKKKLFERIYPHITFLET